MVLEHEKGLLLFREMRTAEELRVRLPGRKLNRATQEGMDQVMFVFVLNDLE